MWIKELQITINQEYTVRLDEELVTLSYHKNKCRGTVPCSTLILNENKDSRLQRRPLSATFSAFNKVLKRHGPTCGPLQFIYWLDSRLFCINCKTASVCLEWTPCVWGAGRLFSSPLVLQCFQHFFFSANSVSFRLCIYLQKAGVIVLSHIWSRNIYELPFLKSQCFIMCCVPGTSPAEAEAVYLS